MTDEELKLEIRKEVKSQIQEAEITDIKVEKLRNEIKDVKLELKEDIYKLDNKVSEVENRLESKISEVKEEIKELKGMFKVMMGIIITATVGIFLILIKGMLGNIFIN